MKTISKLVFSGLMILSQNAFAEDSLNERLIGHWGLIKTNADEEIDILRIKDQDKLESCIANPLLVAKNGTFRSLSRTTTSLVDTVLSGISPYKEIVNINCRSFGDLQICQHADKNLPLVKHRVKELSKDAVEICLISDDNGVEDDCSNFVRCPKALMDFSIKFPPPLPESMSNPDAGNYPFAGVWGVRHRMIMDRMRFGYQEALARLIW